MYNTVFIRNLKSLSNSEISNFDLFLNSPFFNTKSILVSLFDYIKKYHPQYERLDSSNIIESVFEGKINKAQLTKHLSSLMSLLKRFIKIQQLEKEENVGDLYLLKYYNEQGLVLDFASHYKRMKDNLDLVKIQDVNYQLFKFNLTAELHRFEGSKDLKTLKIFYEKIEKNKNKRQELLRKNKVLHQDYNEASKQLDNFYFLQKIIHLCQMSNYRNEINKEKASDKQIRALFDKYIYPLMPKNKIVYQVWHEAFELLISDKSVLEKNYIRFKKSLKEHYSAFSIDDLRILLGYLQNATKRFLNPNSIDYFRQLFEFYNLQLDANVFDVHLNSSILRNIVTVSIVLKEFQWIDQFFERYKENIVKTRDGSFEFSMAKIKFYKISNSMLPNKDIELENLYFELHDVIEPMVQTSFDKLHIRILKLQISYELKTYESLVNSVNKYLNTSFRDNDFNIDPADRHLKGNRNFKNLLTRIFYLREDLEFISKGKRKNIGKKLDEILAELNDFNINIANRFWLIEKVELVNKNNLKFNTVQ